jgi:hypothetical protein
MLVAEKYRRDHGRGLHVLAVSIEPEQAVEHCGIFWTLRDFGDAGFQ